MNGRIYDPTLGRFLQADPFIQAPQNSQSYNRYSYVLNNPLSYTDPSGYFFKSLFKKLNKALGNFAPVFGLALMFIPGMQAFAAQSIWHAAAVGFGIGGISTGSLKGALIGAFTGAAFHQIGSHFNNLHGDNLRAAIGGSSDKLYNFGGNLLTSGQVTQQIAAHAVVGGVAAELAGGKFGHGFISAGVTKGAGGAFLKGGTNLSSGDIAKGTVISAAIGGTVSKLTGGKFANGASTGAFQYLFNQAKEGWLQKTREWNINRREHIYGNEFLVCGNGEPSCTEAQAAEALRLYPAPGANGKTPIQDGDSSHIDGFGTVDHRVDPDGKGIWNFTRSNHTLHNGWVHRRVVSHSGGIYIRTYGAGDGNLAWINENLDDMVWGVSNNKIWTHIHYPPSN